LATGLLSLYLFLSYLTVLPYLPSFQEIKERYRQSEAVLLDRRGEVIQEMRVDARGRRLAWSSLHEISPALVRAVLVVEDRRFARHHGVDWLALPPAMMRSLSSDRRRGASTITMQLLPFVVEGMRPERGRRSWQEKLRQMRAALALEDGWTKEQILEAYLNLVSFRGELQGIAAASEGIFGKAPSGLTDAESLLLASLITSPNAAAPDLIRRASLFAEAMERKVSVAEIERAGEALFVPYRITPPVSLAPHLASLLLRGGAQTVRSTLDGRLQRFVLDSLSHHLSQIRDRRAQDGAVLVADNRSGDILAYAGNGGVFSSALHVDGVRALRQAGSTLKPFLYGLAIEKGYLTPASVLDDSPLSIATPSGLYVPQDYDRVFRGQVSLRTALSSSINVPAVRTLLLVGERPFVQRLRNLEFEGITEEPEFYGFSLALGSADVRLMELVNAYRSLANRGVWSGLRLRPEEKTKSRRVFSEAAVFIISAILSDREARSTTFGLENPLSTRFWSAVKTGTSKDMRDNWCIGYSERYTVGVWVGNFNGEPMQDVSGVTGAAPLWLDIMNHLHKEIPSRPPLPPSGVVKKEVVFSEGIEPEREEWFLKGTEPERIVQAESVHTKPRIAYPVEGTVISLDPEIPEDLQAVLFRSRPASADLQWVLDGERVSPSGEPFLWKPTEGRHTLSLVDRGSRVVDSLEFLVR
ncbi:MAG: penicillin-binding protein 1C, partial [Thermodesulfovibrionales bacterium]